MTVATNPAQIIAKLAGLYERQDRPDAAQRTAAYWWGAQDDEVAFAIGVCDTVSNDPVAKHLYQFKCAEDMAGDEAVAAVVSWCNGKAAECAVARNTRNRLRIPSYRVEWGRQAGNDGAALAMWGAGIRDVLPGVNKRAAKYGCRDEAYLRVRNHVELEAMDLIEQFSRDMEMVLNERFDPDFRARWERKTGRLFPRY
jgi:hypothetical protein